MQTHIGPEYHDGGSWGRPYSVVCPFCNRTFRRGDISHYGDCGSGYRYVWSEFVNHAIVQKGGGIRPHFKDSALTPAVITNFFRPEPDVLSCQKKARAMFASYTATAKPSALEKLDNVIAAQLVATKANEIDQFDVSESQNDSN